MIMSLFQVPFEHKLDLLRHEMVIRARYDSQFCNASKFPQIKRSVDRLFLHQNYDTVRV